MDTVTSRASATGRMPALFLACALAAALAPLARQDGAGAASKTAEFPGWPSSYEDRPLRPLPLGTKEEAFARDFPGRIARFTDGRREIIYRFVAEPTRRLHPAADCFKGSGYAITPLPLRRSTSGTDMGCFRARRGETDLAVCEAIRSDTGKSWSDLSSWYWDALLGKDAGKWWSVVVAAPIAPAEPETFSPP